MKDYELPNACLTDLQISGIYYSLYYISWVVHVSKNVVGYFICRKRKKYAFFVLTPRYCLELPRATSKRSNKWSFVIFDSCVIAAF